MSKKIIQTNSAPKAIGTYSQAVQKNNIVFLSGQIPLNPETMDLVEGIEAVSYTHLTLPTICSV